MIESPSPVRGSGLCICLFLSVSWAQSNAPVAPPATPPEAPSDLLGRTSPRGTLLGFLRAARKEEFEAAAQFLNTRQRGKAAADLARELFVVLDRRLPARLNEVSDRQEGSLAFLTRPDEDLIGTIRNPDGDFDVTVEKIASKNGPVWLFSARTLEFIPDLFGEVQATAVEDVLPGALVHTRILQVPLYEWLGVLVGLPFLYVLSVVLNRLLSPWAGRVRRHLRKRPNLPDPVFLPHPVRLLLGAGIIRWTLSRITLPLLGRQFWTTIATTFTIAAIVWLGIELTGLIESIARRRLERTHNPGAASILRLARRTVDMLIFFSGLLTVLDHVGLNVTGALAGLGVGGIAVALAAQKTLENVIGGVSVIFDKALNVGDLLIVGNTTGFVEYIGLRSTRIRTFNRTLVSVPNGQLATVQLENVASRDKFWFHPNLHLHYETTPAMIRSILGGITDLLSRHARVDTTSVRVNLVGLAASSLEVEIFAYVFAGDWLSFLPIQQALLLRVMEIVEAAGSRIAIPAQISYVAADASMMSSAEQPAFPSRRDAHRTKFD